MTELQPMVTCPDCGGSGRVQGSTPYGESPRDYEDDCPACAGYGEMPWEFRDALVEGGSRLTECRVCGEVCQCVHFIFDLCARHYALTFYGEDLLELEPAAMPDLDEIPFCVQGQALARGE